MSVYAVENTAFQNRGTFGGSSQIVYEDAQTTVLPMTVADSDDAYLRSSASNAQRLDEAFTEVFGSEE